MRKGRKTSRSPGNKTCVVKYISILDNAKPAGKNHLKCTTKQWSCNLKSTFNQPGSVAAGSGDEGAFCEKEACLSAGTAAAPETEFNNVIPRVLPQFVIFWGYFLCPSYVLLDLQQVNRTPTQTGYFDLI